MSIAVCLRFGGSQFVRAIFGSGVDPRRVPGIVDLRSHKRSSGR